MDRIATEIETCLLKGIGNCLLNPDKMKDENIFDARSELTKAIRHDSLQLLDKCKTHGCNIDDIRKHGYQLLKWIIELDRVTMLKELKCNWGLNRTDVILIKAREICANNGQMEMFLFLNNWLILKPDTL